MSRYMDAGYSGNCKATTCLHESRKIRRGDPIYWDTVERYAYHADCHRTNIKFDQVLNAIANVAPVVCDLGDKDIDRKYAAAYNLLSSVYHDGAAKGIGPDTITTVLQSDAKELAQSARESVVIDLNRETLRSAANMLTRAGLPVALNLGGIGYAESLEFHLEPWTIPTGRIGQEKHEVTIHFTNTWGGDDGYTSFYRVYCQHEVNGPGYKRLYILDQWARDVIADAGVKPCYVDDDYKELVGYVLEAIGAIRSHGAVEGIPCEDYTADDLVSARGAKCTPKYKRCTSDDPTDHQGDTCPVHEADTVPFDIIRQSLDVIRKRTGSERVQREADVIEAQLHQIEMLP